jgi:response regulator RpfG family c-di-GMP phosphodiesterase
MNRIRILAVDDNVVNLATLEQELQGKYEVVALNSGERAVRYLRREKVDLILLDIEMPNMDGLDTLREIRSQHNGGATVPVIFLTSVNDRSTVVEGMKLGIMDFIVKPYKTEDLYARVEQCLKRRGTIPIEADELRLRLKEISGLIRDGALPQAATKSGELMGYQIDEDISGRIGVIKSKLEAGDGPAALAMLARILRLLDTRQEQPRKGTRRVSRVELTVKLKYAINALSNFDIEDAAGKIGEVLDCEMPNSCRKRCEQALECLQKYDDEEAEKLLRSALNMM